MKKTLGEEHTCFSGINRKERVKIKAQRRGSFVKEEEKKPINWEVCDPKPPVIRSGHLENKRH